MTTSDAAARSRVDVIAPAKINLTLHVTGQRADGYHLLDSLVAFAPRAADRLVLTRTEALSLEVHGPFAAGVPEDARNLCWQAATLYGAPAAISLDKRLPHAAGIGGGSSDAAAVLRGLEALHGAPFAGDATVLGADVPVCRAPGAQRMSGIGERLSPVDLPPLFAVLVNPGVAVPTGPVFAGLATKQGAPMTPQPAGQGGAAFADWLAAQRNDLQAPAIALAPAVAEALEALSARAGVWLSRMSGSGATCFGLCDSADAARGVAEALRAAHPGWWIVDSELV
jgi:4-diphosphocytidyl-2-C-methyl-D-erythritol kinase